jgi:hypothetical protein
MKQLFLFFSCLFQVLLSVAQTSSFITHGIGGGSALFFPKINPANDDEFYISCDMSELFHSSDFGQTYSQIHFSKLQVFNTSTYEFTNIAQQHMAILTIEMKGTQLKPQMVKLLGMRFREKTNFTSTELIREIFFVEIIIKDDSNFYQKMILLGVQKF